MAKVELRVYPPLSYEMTSKRLGPHVIEEKVDHAETLGDLLTRVSSDNQSAWKKIFNTNLCQMQQGILAVLNGTVLTWEKAPETCLSDGDQVDFRITYLGG